MTVLEFSHDGLILYSGLLALEVLQFLGTLSLFLFLLLLSHLQLFVADLPELGELDFFVLSGSLNLTLPLDLQLSRTLNGGLHLNFALLLSLKETVGAVLSLSDLPVKNFLLVVLQGTQLLDLSVNHALPGLLLVTEALLFALLLEGVEVRALLRKDLNLLFLLDLLAGLGLLDLHELLVGLGQVGAHLGDLLLALDFALLLALQVLLSLALDEFALEHLLFELLDEAEFEVLELLADVFRVGLLEPVLLLELGAHLLVVLAHLLLLHLHPVRLNVPSNHLLPLRHRLLRFLLVSNVAHQHLSFECLDHILLLEHSFVGLFNLLTSELVLVILLFSVHSPSFDL